MKYSWPYVNGGRLLSRTDTALSWPLTPIQQEYLINRLFDRCNVDVVIKANGHMHLLARTIKIGPARPRGSK